MVEFFQQKMEGKRFEVYDDLLLPICRWWFARLPSSPPSPPPPPSSPPASGEPSCAGSPRRSGGGTQTTAEDSLRVVSEDPASEAVLQASEAVLRASAVLLSEARTRASELRRGTAGRQCLLAPLFMRRSATPRMSNSATQNMRTCATPCSSES